MNRSQIGCTARNAELPFEGLEPRRVLASLNVQYTAELQTHEVLPPPFAGPDHLSLLITPQDPMLFHDIDGDLQADEDPLFTLRSDGSWALSLGSASNAEGKLEVTFNRNFDIDIHPSHERYTLTQPANFADSRAWINELISRSSAYQDNLQYELFPETQGGFNSNSYIAGLFDVTGTIVPDPSTIFVTRGGQPGSYPGYSVPVPAVEFGTGPAKRLDAVLVVDTTQGMEDDLAAIQASAVSLIADLHQNYQVDGNDDVRVAIVDYRDFALSPYGSAGDYPFNDVQSFLSSRDASSDALQSLSIGDGGDFRESVFSALMHAIESDSFGLWRGDGVQKSVFIVGDAPGHDPEPMTGWTHADLDQAAAEADPSGPVDIYAVSIGSNTETIGFFEEVAFSNRGLAFNAQTSSDVVDALSSAFSAATHSAPVILSLETSASFIGSAIEGQTVTLSGTFVDGDPAETFTATVAWGDGTVDTANIVQAGGLYMIDAEYAYPRGGKYKVNVSLVDGNGKQDSARANALVTGANARGGRLNVVGTQLIDAVNVYPGRGGVFVTASFLVEETRWFAAEDVYSLGVYLGDGNDAVVVATSLVLPTRLVGGAGHDGLFGGNGPDRISGRDGDDVIRGFGGNDFIEGNTGSDWLFGMLGNDIVKGGNGNDYLSGGAGLDELRGGNGIDTLYGDEDADLLHGGNDDDFLHGNDGNDLLIGGNGNDMAWGDGGNDVLLGSFGNDQLFGGIGDDVLSGDDGDDELDGGDDWDELFGGPGVDLLINGEVNHP